MRSDTGVQARNVASDYDASGGFASSSEGAVGADFLR
ncbi:MAG: hypothetical protein HW398_1091 [Acidobacteria bacterium]|nr:hypothetical protein [Acidobacteriota bacterium]